MRERSAIHTNPHNAYSYLFVPNTFRRALAVVQRYISQQVHRYPNSSRNESKEQRGNLRGFFLFFFFFYFFTLNAFYLVSSHRYTLESRVLPPCGLTGHTRTTSISALLYTESHILYSLLSDRDASQASLGGCTRESCHIFLVKSWALLGSTEKFMVSMCCARIDNIQLVDMARMARGAVRAYNR